jgi:cyanophycinase
MSEKHSRPRAVKCAFLALLAVGSPLAAADAFAQYDPAAPEPVGKIRGSLVMHGGGAIQESVRDRFVQLAGGKQARIVVIPTASSRADETDDYEEWLTVWRPCAAELLSVLHTRSRDRAEEEDFVAPLRQATGVWFSGGDQSRLEAAYIGTAVETALEGVLERGGVVGGTSAGAAFLSRVMIGGGTVHRGLNLLPGAVIDQHFIVRNRQERLGRVLREHPGLVGFGVDERAALIVRGRAIEIVGDSDVVICMAPSPTRPERTDRLSPGMRADLIALSRAAVARSRSPFPPAQPDPTELASGSLVIVGGGGIPSGLLERFVELAGGADAPIVHIPCELADVILQEPGFCHELRKAGAINVQWLHTKDRARANFDSAFLEPLVRARHLVRRRQAMESRRLLSEHNRTPINARGTGSWRCDRRLVGRGIYPRRLHAARRPAGQPEHYCRRL